MTSEQQKQVQLAVAAFNRAVTAGADKKELIGFLRNPILWKQRIYDFKVVEINNEEVVDARYGHTLEKETVEMRRVEIEKLGPRP